MRLRCPTLVLSLGLASLMATACGSSHQHGPAVSTTTSTSTQAAQSSIIDPWEPRFGRTRPVVAVLAANGGDSNTELTDYVIPYGVLTAADVANVVTVTTNPGTVTMRPALRTQAQMTIADFDAHYPKGADYVIVPALQPRDDASAVGWIKQQAAKGSSTVSICNGAMTVARTGLMDGHDATGHWAGHERRSAMYPNVTWRKNARYVADGKIVSSAGVSASMPVAIALVAAIAGRERAEATAQELGIDDWTPEHDSDRFASLPRPVGGEDGTGAPIGVGLVPGIDEIALALTAEAYSQSGHTQAFALASSDIPVRSRRGITFLPDMTAADPRLVALVDAAQAEKPAQALDIALAEIEDTYGADAALAVARVMEYPKKLN